MQTTILLWCPQGSEFSPLLEAARVQFTVFNCYEKKAGIGDSPLHLLGAAIKLRPCSLVWTALQLCCHHISAWACLLLIQTLTQTLRFNIPAWSQTSLITMGLLQPGLSAKPGWGDQSALLASLRCGGTGSVCVRLLPVPAVFPSSATGALSFRKQTASAVPWQILSGPFFIQTFTSAEIALGFYHVRDKYIQKALASFIIVLDLNTFFR